MIAHTAYTSSGTSEHPDSLLSQPDALRQPLTSSCGQTTGEQAHTHSAILVLQSFSILIDHRESSMGYEDLTAGPVATCWASSHIPVILPSIRF